MLIIIFSVTLNWLPAMGMQETSGASSFWTLLRHMALPSIALSLIPMGVITRMVRASVLEILQQDFVLTLRAKGLWVRTVTRHVMKNAAPPVLTLMGLQFGYLLGGSVLVETVFSWPGSGFLLNLAIFQRDIPMLQGVILVLATFFVLLNLLVDILHSFIDPRIRRT
jgi:peptide/nickel transport system permease protein